MAFDHMPDIFVILYMKKSSFDRMLTFLLKHHFDKHVNFGLLILRHAAF